MPNPYMCYSSKFITTTQTQQLYSNDNNTPVKQAVSLSTKRHINELDGVDEQSQVKKKRKRSKQQKRPPAGYPPLYCEVYNPVTLQLVQQTGHQLNSALQDQFEAHIDNVVKGVTEHQGSWSDEEKANLAELKKGFMCGVSGGNGEGIDVQEEDQFDTDCPHFPHRIEAGSCRQDLVTYIVCPHNSSWQASFFLKNVGCEYSEMGFGVCVPPFASKISPTGGGVVTYKQVAVPKDSDCSGWMAGLRQSLEALQRHLLFHKHHNLLGEEATVMVYVVPSDNSSETIMKSTVIAAQVMAPCLHNSNHSKNTSKPGFYDTTPSPHSKMSDPSTPQSDPTPVPQNPTQNDDTPDAKILLANNNNRDGNKSDTKISRNFEDTNNNTNNNCDSKSRFKQSHTPKHKSSQKQQSLPQDKFKRQQEEQYVRLQGNTNQSGNKVRSLLEMKQQLFSHKIRIICVPQSWFRVSSPVCHRKVAYESYQQASNMIQADDAQINFLDDIFEDTFSSIAPIDQNQLSVQDSNLKSFNSSKFFQSLQQHEIQVLTNSSNKQQQLNTDVQLHMRQQQRGSKIVKQGPKNSFNQKSEVKSSQGNHPKQQYSFDKHKKSPNTPLEQSQQKSSNDRSSQQNVVWSDTCQENLLQKSCLSRQTAMQVNLKTRDLSNQPNNSNQQLLQFQINGLHCCYEFSQKKQQGVSRIVRAVVVDSKGQQMRSGVKYYKGRIEERQTLQQVLYWVVGFCIQHVKNNSSVHFLSFQKLGYVTSNEQELLENLIKNVVRNLGESSVRIPLLDNLQYVTLHSVILQKQTISQITKHSPEMIYYRVGQKRRSGQIDFVYQIREIENKQFQSQGFILINNFAIKTTDITLFNLVANNLFNRRDGRGAAVVIKDAQSPADSFPTCSVGETFLEISQNLDEVRQQPSQLCNKQDVLKKIFQDLLHQVRLTQREYCGCQFSHVFGCKGKALCVPINLVTLMQIESLYHQLDLNCVELKRKV